MQSSHFVRAAKTSSHCRNSLQASSSKIPSARLSPAGNTGRAGQSVHRRCISTSQNSLLKASGSSRTLLRPTGAEVQSSSSSRSIATSSASESYATALSALPTSQYVPRYDQTSLPRRQTMTASETRKIEDMFSSIFNAASRQEELGIPHNNQEEASWSNVPTMRFSTKPKPVPFQWTRVGDDILDQRKEEIERCESDQALYAWTLDLFGELEASLSQVHRADTVESDDTSSLQSSSSLQLSEDTQNASASLPAFAYPQLLSIVMRSFRTRYNDPHTALAIFDHARNASPLSYVTCCGTAAYNELIETKWDSFRDLQGVCDALEDMKLNKVRVDTRTMKLVEGLRREVGQRNFWQEEGFGDSHSGVMNLLERIESVCWPDKGPQDRNQNRIPPRNARWTKESEAWKRPSSSNDEHDRLDFV
ncbi:hypothetical protein M408DRAFT_328093 [Serendipita vermifera MAFF 305830]|uniref:Mtf2-like C-terminal domain-containing protein n=1 Tax=Serendipita vermifera MAFF 305830 TaxID=933852 RepID=A0A0C2WWM3_SERVB|nr:hypothetical protein M408DRAFT_328093 [Serendipita vermifera MAFF 305830]